MKYLFAELVQYCSYLVLLPDVAGLPRQHLPLHHLLCSGHTCPDLTHQHTCSQSPAMSCSSHTLASGPLCFSVILRLSSFLLLPSSNPAISAPPPHPPLRLPPNALWSNSTAQAVKIYSKSDDTRARPNPGECLRCYMVLEWVWVGKQVKLLQIEFSHLRI